MKTLSCRIPDEMAEKLAALATQTGRSQYNILTDLIVAGLLEKDEETKELEYILKLTRISLNIACETLTVVDSAGAVAKIEKATKEVGL